MNKYKVVFDPYKLSTEEKITTACVTASRFSFDVGCLYFYDDVNNLTVWINAEYVVSVGLVTDE